MCGIAGRIMDPEGQVGADLTALMQALAHRGSDSTGYALYGEPLRSGYIVRAVAHDRSRLDEGLEMFTQVALAHGADLTEDPTWDDTDQMHVSVRLVIGDLDVTEWLADADAIGGLEIQSVGRSLEIIKDVGDAESVAAKHGVDAFVGTHGVANARMATESRVSPTASHPFWARPFPDIAIVHNGQLTNYFLLKERLERNGYTFLTENDSELIAVWLSVQLSSGLTLPEALEKSIFDLDGCFTYLISTADQIGMAKDKFAIKPLAAAEIGVSLAIATEEQAVRMVHPDEVPITNYDGPSLVQTWDVPVHAHI